MATSQQQEPASLGHKGKPGGPEGYAARWTGSPVILTAGFVLLVLALNSQLFTRPVIEFTDYAANSLLVQQAKHFTLLTGHYSRWRFHHPGPAFLYLFALGEFVFYNLLHLVAAPYNAQVLIMILFNGALLCAALYVFRWHAKLSVPVALLVTLVVTVLVNGGAQPSMLISNWMPDVLLFAYVLFAVSAASVLTGETRGLPFLAFSGMLLIHAHVAQFLFVGVIGGGAVAGILRRGQREGRWRRLIAERRRDFIAAAAIVLIFALPPLLELALDRPNNLDALLAYQRQFGSVLSSVGIAIGYFACFLLFIHKPELALPKGPGGILAMGFSHPAVAGYWITLAVLFIVALAHWKKGRRTPFLKYLAWVMAATVVLFLYWAMHIVGGFFAFNGSFINCVHLLAWFVLVAEMEPALNRRVMRTVNIAGLVLLVGLSIAERKALRSAITGDPGVLAAATAVPAANSGKLPITFDHDDWQWAAGLANSMKRMHKPFCVDQNWGFLFSARNVCADAEMLASDRLQVSSVPASCALPCRPIYRGRSFSVMLYPHGPVTFPLEVGLGESPEVEITGFYDDEGTHRWLQKHASIRFQLSPQLPPAACFRMAIQGFIYAGRPTRASVNGHTLGTLSKSVMDTAVFVVPYEMLRPGKVNSVTLDTENAGPVGSDKREIGFAFKDLVLRAAAADESCAVNPGTEPQYAAISMDWGPSCYGLEGAPPRQWRWCGPDSLLEIHNTASEPRRVTFSADLSTDSEKAAPLEIQCPFFKDRVTVSRRRLAYSRSFTVPPGDHALLFLCGASRSAHPGDPRNLVLRFENFSLELAH